ncbi:MAG: ECF RNA polymerase sigma factor SigK [Actinomycetota bacterium]|nr:ECF RNA polymerase sigma factor SigK [Actinomycetota bacterium]
MPPVAAASADPDTSSVDELLERVATGDHLAFAQLYRQTSARLFGLVKQVLRDPAQSEEVGQEVFLEIWQTASGFQRAKGRGITWIFTMAHRRAIDRVRASQASRDRDLRIGIRDRDREHDSVVEKVELMVESERVRLALAELSEVQRQAIELAYFGGYTQSELAAYLGVPLSTAKTRMRDGLLNLRRALAEEDPVAA